MGITKFLREMMSSSIEKQITRAYKRQDICMSCGSCMEKLDGCAELKCAVTGGVVAHDPLWKCTNSKCKNYGVVRIGIGDDDPNIKYTCF